MLHTVFPPEIGRQTVTKLASGRTYSAAPGACLVNVPDFDADMLEANGWTKACKGGVGSSNQRPVNPARGAQFHDTTLGYIITHAGQNIWRHPATGAAV